MNSVYTFDKTMDTVAEVSKELQIPLAYIKRASRKDRVVAVVQRSWLNTLVKTQSLPEFTYHETLSSEEVQAWLHQGEDLGATWNKVLIKVFVKGQKKVIPLPRPRPVPSKSEPDLSFAQVLHYVSQTNHKNLWKEAFKKYLNGSVPMEEKTNPAINFVSCESVMRDIIYRIYGCPVFHVGSDTREPQADGKGRKYEAHNNVLPAVCAVETRRSFLVIYRLYVAHTVQDCVTFSPALLGSSNMKPLFIVYQLLEAMRDMHDRGMILGDISLSDVMLSENLWIQIIPHLEDNIHDEPRPKRHTRFTAPSDVKASTFYDRMSPDDSAVGQTCDRCSPCSTRCNNEQQDSNSCLEACKGKVAGGFSTSQKSFRCDSDGVSCELKRLCELWVRGQLSNFDYLMALNDWAGRKYGDPTSHYVMPWVTDFAHRSGMHWRDLSRSKYRLNKGDKQLDFTYDTASNGTQVPHHVSDVLSEITYYVYLARRTPKSVLCKYVRTKWVPAEYPSSIQRLQEWTPDECIPEFFSNPAVFQSVHEDMSNLDVPPWATSVQDFIEWHREALESPHVSERLHQWIDLTFGYKLSGSAAVKAKNVCLHLVDSHTELTNTGVVQLFAHPHPQRLMQSPFWGKTPPKLHPAPREKKRVGERMSEDEGQSSAFEEDEVGMSSLSQNQLRSSPLVLTRILSRSRGSLQVSSQPTQPCDESGSWPPGTELQKQSASGACTQTIYLPKDFNPTAAIQMVELQHSFLMRTFHQGPEVDWFIEGLRGSPTTGFMQVVASRRIREMQVLGCLVVELFLPSKLRALDSYNSASFDQRLEGCHSVLRWSSDSLPHCVKHVISLLLQVNLEPSQELGATGEERLMSVHPFRYPTVTQHGLPPPSAHQLLQPLLFPAMLPFPHYFPHMYKLLEVLSVYEDMMEELVGPGLQDSQGSTHAECDVSYKRQLTSKVAECRVKTSARELAILLPQLSDESLTIILPYIVRLLNDQTTSVLAAWYLFDPVALVLGPRKTAEHLLSSVISLYDYKDNVSMDSCNQQLKLYHRSFLLQLIVRLGLKMFLKNFVTALVEAVGGYRDRSHSEGTSQHQRADLRASASHLKTCEIEENLEEVDADEVLSPIEEDFSAESDNRNVHQENDHNKEPCENMPHGKNESKDNEPEIFLLQAEDGKASPTEEEEIRLYNIMAQLDLNISQAGSEGEGEGDDSRSHNFQDEASANAVDDLSEQSERLVHDQLSGEVNFTEQFVEENLRKEDRFQRVNAQCKVSDMSADSVVWLSHRLGPVLSARHLSRNLLRMLTLCYLGRENLQPAVAKELKNSLEMSTLSITNSVLVGDQNAAKVIECLSSIATLYGEQFILLQYLPHMGELIGLCKKKLTHTLEGGLVGALSLLSRIVPYLSDTSLMDHLQEILLKNILHPSIRLLSTTKFVFPSGEVGRAAVAGKTVDALYVIAQRIGQEMTKKHLATPSLQRFFLAFDKAYERLLPEDALTAVQGVEASSSPLHVGTEVVTCVNSRETANDYNYRSPVDSSCLEICREGSSIASAVRGCPVQGWFQKNDTGDSFLSISFIGSDEEWKSRDPSRSKAVEELKAVFTPKLAHLSYLPFVMFLGDTVMEQSLKNAGFITELCFKYEKEMQGEQPSARSVDVFYLSDYLGLGGPQVEEKSGTGNLGSNVSVVGNRIDLQRTDIPSVQLQQADSKKMPASVSGDLMSLISRKMENTKRHLRGNWLAYWEHEIGRAEKDTRFNFKQIKLQTFAGHTNSVRTLYVLNNENSFISGSRDKTVKLWSLRSQGDGNAVSHCQWTYMGHRKSVVGLTFVESLQLVASCDYGVHVWDPFMGSLVGTLESARHPQVNVLQAMPPPSTTFLAATTDMVALRLVDTRTCSFVSEMRVSLNPAGYIRCMTVGASGNWVAVGQSTGFLTILDIRTGLILASWKGHEGEVLQLVSANDRSIISSSLDQAVSVWSSVDGKHQYHMKGHTEPVHCLSVYGNELILGTTANRIGVHTAVDEAASFSSTRLRSDTFRGVLTTMVVLPLNRLLLLGADSGSISLLC